MPTPEERRDARDAQRRQLIVQAARQCFLQHGYDKTSLDDIAKKARISRPLIYRKFDNKEQLFGAVFESALAGRQPAAEEALQGRGSKREKLLRVCELLLVEPWEETAGAPMARELQAAFARVHPELAARQAKTLAKCAQALLGAKELAELFLLAADGMFADAPQPKVLRRRLELLVEKLTPA